MNRRHTEARFVLCIHNKVYRASLELRKVYQILPDAKAAADDLVRVIDESGEDYLYPKKWFVRVVLPRSIEKTLLIAS